MPRVNLLAERAGFEPAVRLSPYTRFPGVRLKPLIHLSGSGEFYHAVERYLPRETGKRYAKRWRAGRVSNVAPASHIHIEVMLS